MAQTRIEWTSQRKLDGTVIPGYTFNPWEGCEKVSPGCAGCYAEQRDKQYHNGEHWGPNGTRLMHREAYWKQPEKWNREAEQAGERRRVFCASLADVFEDRPELLAPRLRLFDLIRRTPRLDWLLLTKRPQNIDRLMLETVRIVPGNDGSQDDLLIWLSKWASAPPANIWLGTSVEDQRAADTRIPELLKIPATVRFLSCEPLLGPVEFSDVTKRADAVSQIGKKALAGIHWVIVGGESGPNARPMHPQWARSLRDQCKAADVAYFFKQHGEWHPDDRDVPSSPVNRPPRREAWRDSQVRRHHWPDGTMSLRLGKEKSGRLLDGVEWNQSPWCHS